MPRCSLFCFVSKDEHGYCLIPPASCIHAVRLPVFRLHFFPTDACLRPQGYLCLFISLSLPPPWRFYLAARDCLQEQRTRFAFKALLIHQLPSPLPNRPALGLALPPIPFRGLHCGISLPPLFFFFRCRNKVPSLLAWYAIIVPRAYSFFRTVHSGSSAISPIFCTSSIGSPFLGALLCRLPNVVQLAAPPSAVTLFIFFPRYFFVYPFPK